MSVLESQSVPFDLLNDIDGGVIVLDALHRIQHWNSWMQAFSGFAADELLGLSLWEAFPALHGTHLHMAVEDALVSRAPSVLSHTLHPLLFPLRCRDGRAMLHDVTVLPLSLRSGQHCLVQIKDVTERRRMQAALLESRMRFRAAFDHAATGIGEIDRQGRFLRVNERLCAILGRERGELLRLGLRDVVHPDDWDDGLLAGPGLPDGGRTMATERRCMRKDGGQIWISVTSSAVLGSGGRPDYLVVTMEDVSERRRAEAEREQLLVRRELLTREAHHRVKNSLALAVSLLSVQSYKAADPTVRDQLLSARHRIMAIARLHDRLQESDELNLVEVGPFLRGLCADLEGAVAAEDRRHSIRVEISAEATLEVDQALPLAIVVTELVTNAVKHGRPEGAPVEVVVGCHRSGPREILLSVTDNGIGLPAGFDPARSAGLGLTILNRLCEQLSTELQVLDGGGAGFALRIEA